MGRHIPNTIINDIQHAANIVEVIGEYVHLKQSGKNFTGLCPFHAEKTPSFSVSEDKQLFYCFGCGVGGNVFTFLMNHNHISFPEAVALLGKRYGVAVSYDNISPEEKQKIDLREQVLTLNRQVAEFYTQTLYKQTTAREYLNNRGITNEIIEHFNLGFAPSGWDSIVQFCSKHRIYASIAEKAGLIIQKDRGGYYDRFRERIMFPIKNLSGYIIGFGGRVLDDSKPKYLNSPETVVYDKSQSLYGLFQSKSSCRQKGTVYIVEGYFDMISLYAKGIQNVVATLGTALTHYHIRHLLKVNTSQLVLLFDSDEAGLKAVWRSLKMFDEEQIDAKILILPKGHDPDSFVNEHGADAFQDLAKNALSVISFIMESAIQKFGLTPEGKTRIINALQKPLATLQDPILRSLHIKALAEKLELNEEMVLEKIRQTAQANTHVNPNQSANQVASPMSQQQTITQGRHENTITNENKRLEESVISMMIHHPVIIDEIKKRKLIEDFTDHTLQAIGKILMTYPNAHKSELMSYATTDTQRQKIASISMKPLPWDDTGCQRLITQLERIRSKQRRKAIAKKIETALNENKINAVEKLQQELEII